MEDSPARRPPTGVDGCRDHGSESRSEGHQLRPHLLQVLGYSGMKSVKFWRENPANNHSFSSGKFRLEKIRQIVDLGSKSRPEDHQLRPHLLQVLWGISLWYEICQVLAVKSGK